MDDEIGDKIYQELKRLREVLEELRDIVNTK